MDKVKILVACHKPSDVYRDEVYTPIHVGRAISKCKDEMADMIGDDTGDNISELNPYFCELTAQYWAWKNLHDVEYIGLCHYRRYFKERITLENIETVMKGVDIVLPSKLFLRVNNLTRFSSGLNPEDVTIFYLYMLRRFPEQKECFLEFFTNNNYLNPCNMFICRKDLFDDFCEWQFSILNDLFELVPCSPYSRQKRLMGYIAEALLPYYAYQKALKVKEQPLVTMLGNSELILNSSIKERVKSKLFFSKGKRLFSVRDDVMVGLKQDGILVKMDELFSSRYGR